MRDINQKLLTNLTVNELNDPHLTNTPPLKWGVLATGGIAKTFTRQILAAGGEIVAVGSRSIKNAESFAGQFGNGNYKKSIGNLYANQSSNHTNAIKPYGSYTELLNDADVEAVYIATPHSEHYQVGMQALEHGKHLLIEKAITRNATEAKAIFKLANDKNLFVMEAMWTRFLPHIREVKAIVNSGKIGEIVSVTADFGICKDYNPQHRLFNPELAGGALLDLGVYPISFTHYLLGKPDKITSQMYSAPTGVDVNLAVTMEYHNLGTLALLHTTSLAFTSTSAVISGTKGRIEIRNPFYRPSDFKLTMNDGSTFEYCNRRENPQTFGDDGRFGMHFQAAEVARQITAGQLQSQVMSWQDSIDVMEIMDEIRTQHNFKFPGE